MPFLCRLGRHVPARDGLVIDPSDMKHRSHCRRCGAALVREPSAGWQVERPAHPKAA